MSAVPWMGRPQIGVALFAATMVLSACSVGGSPVVGAGELPSGTVAGVAVTVRHVDAAARPIVYSQLSSGSLDLYLTTPGGEVPEQLTQGSNHEVQAAWSPDGSQIAFVVTKDLDTGPSDIYAVRADGERLQLLTPGEGCAGFPSWSPDGRIILYLSGTCGGDSFLHVMDSDGSNARQIGTEPVLWPDWSSRGDVVYQAGQDTGALFVTEKVGGKPKRLNTGSLPTGYEAAWSPDGNRIAYVAPTGDTSSTDASKWNEDLFVVKVDGRGGRRVVSTPGNDHWTPAWSPDGRLLLYTADGVGNTATLGTLMVVDLQTLRVRPLFTVPCQCLFPDWRR